MAGVPDTGRTGTILGEKRAQQKVIVQLKESFKQEANELEEQELKRCKGKETRSVPECLQVGKAQVHLKICNAH